MSENKTGIIVSILLFNTMVLFNTPPAFASNGDKLFQQHCSRCHSSPERIKTPSNQINPVLKSETIRTHRFTLDEPTIQSIIEYIGKQQSL